MNQYPIYSSKWCFADPLAVHELHSDLSHASMGICGWLAVAAVAAEVGNLGWENIYWGYRVICDLNIYTDSFFIQLVSISCLYIYYIYTYIVYIHIIMIYL